MCILFFVSKHSLLQFIVFSLHTRCVNSLSQSCIYLFCTLFINLWDNVERLIRNLGMENYHLTARRKILGDLENPNIINIIILNTKKVIYMAKLEGKPPSLIWVQSSIKAIFEYEKYKGLINKKK